MRVCRNIVALALALGLMISAPLTVFAQGEIPPDGEPEPTTQQGEDDGEQPDENTVYDEEQLMEWYATNRGTGSTVSLGCGVTITEGNYEFNWYENIDDNRVTIDTGAFGLIYNGGALSPGEFIITGEGVDNPVLTVIDPGMFRASWVHSIQGLSVTATGKEGVGGTAVFVQPEPGYIWNWQPMSSFFMSESLIASYGTGAVGLELKGSVDVYCLNIQVEGENSIAVSALAGTDLYYCKLKATGTGAAAVSGGDILLDTCAVTPEASDSDVTVIQHRIIGLSGSRFYMPVLLNSANVSCEGYIQFLTELSDGTLTAQTFYVEWDADCIDAIDTSKTGRLTIPGRFLPPFEGLGLTENLNFALELVIDVRDPISPTICEARMFDENKEKHVRFDFWESDVWEAVNLILWRSDDNGATWYDYTNSDNIEWLDEGTVDYWDDWYADNVFYFYYDEITDPIFFQLEAPGYGESNIMALYSTDTGASSGDGGDRTGGDRIIGTKPDENTPSDNGNNPGDEPGTGGNGGTQPGNESGSGDNGDTQSGDRNNSGVPGSHNTPANTDSLLSIPVLTAVPDTSAFTSSDHTVQDGTATGGESLSAFTDMTADSPATAEETNASAQPSIPEPSFPLGTAMALTGSGVILLAGLSIWIKARRLRGR